MRALAPVLAFLLAMGFIVACVWLAVAVVSRPKKHRSSPGVGAWLAGWWDRMWATHEADEQRRARRRARWRPYADPDPVQGIWRIGVMLVDPQHPEREPLIEHEIGTCPLLGDDTERLCLQEEALSTATAANAALD